MSGARPETRSRWCIVVADAAGPEWPVSEDINAQTAPVQYCGLGEPTTMLQKALHRAVRISHPARVMVTAAEAHRLHWQRALWFTRAEHRFLSESPGGSLLLTLGIAGFGIDEDYLLLRARDERPTVAVSSVAQRPMEWIARDIVRQGAVVASGIYIATASTLASLFYKCWPALTHRILND
jgi:mannose-1-phosphate guanylyltransferase